MGRSQPCPIRVRSCCWIRQESSAHSSTGDFEGGVTAFAEIPALETLDADLSAAVAADEGGELEQALAESELSPEEELAFAEFETPAATALDELVAALQRHPGLKITISF